MAAAGSVTATASAIASAGFGGAPSGPATNLDHRVAPRHPEAAVRWAVETDQRLVALTFDDGPAPRWTPMVLDTLAAHRVRATFFLVGERVREHAGLIRGRFAGHEVGNHTWAHTDLARVDHRTTREAIERAHDEIARVTGQEPKFFRPPYGHLSGPALFAAADLGYQVVLWSLQMAERQYADHPPGLVEYIVGRTTPGTIVLAHDTGARTRLVALGQLPAMITGLRRRGFTFVTVSELLAVHETR